MSDVDVFVVLGDESLPSEDRLLHGLAHMIREQARHNRRVEELLMANQQDVQALAERMSTATDRIEQKIGAQAPDVDLSPLDAVADRLDAIAPAEPAPVPAPSNTTEFQPLYLVDGDVNNDPSQWTQLAGFTTPEGRPLFTFVSDATEPGSPATGDGVGGVWHVYVGDLTATQ